MDGTEESGKIYSSTDGPEPRGANAPSQPQPRQSQLCIDVRPDAEGDDKAEHTSDGFIYFKIPGIGATEDESDDLMQVTDDGQVSVSPSNITPTCGDDVTTEQCASGQGPSDGPDS